MEETVKDASIKVGKSTFVVQVQFQQNSTWQGTVNWMEAKKTRRFRSTLELIKLMDDALSCNGEEGPDFAGWDEATNDV